MLRMLPFVLVLAVWLYALIDCILTPESEVRNLPKILWVVIALVPLIGSVCWLVFGRPAQGLRPGSARRPTGRSQPPPPPGPVGPDDDPEFLRKLRRSNEEHEKLLRDWEQNLKDGEQDPRGKRARKQEREDGRKRDEDRTKDGDGQPTAPDGSDNPDGADGSDGQR